MAFTVTSQTLHNGPSKLVVKLLLGGDAEASAVVAVDISALDSTATKLSLLKCQGALVGFAASLLWDATTDVAFLSIPADNPVCFDFCEEGGIPNNAGSGVSGDVLITSTGFATGDHGNLVLTFKKNK